MAAQSPSPSSSSPPDHTQPSRSSNPTIKRLQSLSPPPTTTANKKPHPLPWTHDETVNLIGAYQEKWYSLKRGQLKANQWEDVAAAITARCRGGGGETAKTGTQCRHKMEKLRKRYRAEKQRVGGGAGGSAWAFFDLMDLMERGPQPISVAIPLATVNRQHFGEDDDDDDDREEEDDEDSDFGNAIAYGGGGGSGRAVKKRKFDSVSMLSGGKSSRRLSEFGAMVDGFSGNGRRMGGSYGGIGSGSGSGARGGGGGGFDAKLRNCSNNHRVPQRRRFAYEDEVEEEEEDVNGDEERGVRRGERRHDAFTVELAGQMREFAERFVRLEKRKIEVMKETERCRLEMENKRMEMILVAQRKTVDFITKAFADADASSPSDSDPDDNSNNSRKSRMKMEEGS